MSREGWAPLDWIAAGIYCSEASIRSLLEDARLRRGAEALVLFVIDQSAVLRQLTFVVAGCPTTLESSLRERPQRHGGGELHPALGSILFDKAVSSTDSPATRTLERELERLREVVMASQFQIVTPVELLGDLHPIIVELTNTSELGVSDAIDFPLLLMMLNATPQAENRRDTRVLELVDKQLNVESSDVAEFATRAAELGAELTGADSAAVYLRTSESRNTFVQIGAPVGEHYAQQVELHPATDPELQTSIQRQRTAIRPAGNELFAPIPWISAGGRGTASGVLALHSEKLDTQFNAYKVSLSRNIALRLALQRSLAATQRIGGSIAEMRRALPLDLGPGSEVSRTKSGMPDDVEIAVARLQPHLKMIASETESHSVALRLLLPRDDSGDPESIGHDLCLASEYFVRPDLSHEPLLPSDRTRIEWSVITHGKSEVGDAARTSKPRLYDERETRSILATPLRSEGRLIGVLTLESPFLDNYQHLVPLVEAFGGAVSRTISDSAQLLGKNVMERAVMLDAGNHNALKELSHAMSAVLNSQLEASTQTEIVTALDRAERTIRNSATSSQGSQGGFESLAIIDSLVAGAIKEAKSTLLRREDLPAEVRSTRVSPRAAPSIRSALAIVFSNLVEHSESSPAPEMTGRIVRMDGREFALIQLDNPAERSLDDDLVRNLYRVPVYNQKKGSTRMGGYLAGVQIRSVGGLLSACIRRERRDKYVVTRILVPREETTSGK